MKKIILSSVCIFVILLVTACGKSPPSDPEQGGFHLTAGLMQEGLTAVWAFTLPDKRILLIGVDTPPIGRESQARAYLYDPARNTFSPTDNAPMPDRDYFAATRLASGKVLITGGQSNATNKSLDSAEIYDPQTNRFSVLSSQMNKARVRHTATLLSHGRVLIAGGYKEPEKTGDPNIVHDTAEIFDPVTQTFTLVSAKMAQARYFQRAVALKNGRVLILGGVDADSSFVLKSELYDPATQTFTASGEMIVERLAGFYATLLPDGNVLVTGGMGEPLQETLASAELYETGAGVFSSLPAMQVGRANHFAILFDQDRYVLIGGGYVITIGGAHSSLELYDIAAKRFVSAPRSMFLGRTNVDNAAVALDSGDIIVFGGGSFTPLGKALSSAEHIRVKDKTVELSGGLHDFRRWHTSTTLPNGKVLIAGGYAQADPMFPASRLASTELFDPATGRFQNLPLMIAERAFHTATLLADGTVLITGGVDPGEDAELFDPGSGSFSAVGQMTVPRTGGHAAIRLLDGRVLITGGVSPLGEALSIAEIYNPASKTFSATAGRMTTPRTSHAMSLLSDGKVLITGGGYDIELSSVLKSAEIYDPATGTFTAVPNMNSARSTHTATTLDNGKVLVAGGFNEELYVLNHAELYNPATGKFEFLSGLLTHARMSHTATKLNNGTILLAGGDYKVSNAEVDIFSAATNTFFKSYEMIYGRRGHAASLLHTGQVLITGGREEGIDWQSTEIFTP